MKLDLFILSEFIKLLLFPSYRSTDFDVHRNWLAITHNLPLSEWYYENTSQWTLDYPPFFAYFEKFLTFFVSESVGKDGCFVLTAKDYQYGFKTVIFQRLTVIISELLLALVLLSLKSNSLFALIFMNPGWLILDHIHFQYNGFLFAIFLASIIFVSRKQFLLGAFTFSTVLCFKHIYLYVAPAYFMHLLKFYIFRDFSLLKIVKLGLSTTIPFVLAFLPLYLVGGVEYLQQVLSRLFPFSRGLTHAYWAPNFWALYSAADRVLGFHFKNSVVGGTRGIVGQVAFSNLPDVTPKVTFILTAIFQFLFALFSRECQFIESVTLCAFSAFLFGWHVHEKAILTVLIPFALVCLKSKWHLRAFLPLLISSGFSLLPLIWTSAESVAKYSYTLLYLISALTLLPAQINTSAGVENLIYFGGFLGVVVFYELVPFLVPKYEYAGLMLMSLYSFVGVFVSFVQFVAVWALNISDSTDSNNVNPIEQKKKDVEVKEKS